ncbi:MAG: hypothetical protein Q7R47_00085 [Candidatus Diapherotrites archaeon]|nr:hypothetical protein [Candidatus Diapherotrites archaeon]
MATPSKRWKPNPKRYALKIRIATDLRKHYVPYVLELAKYLAELRKQDRIKAQSRWLSLTEVADHGMTIGRRGIAALELEHDFAKRYAEHAFNQPDLLTFPELISNRLLGAPREMAEMQQLVNASARKYRKYKKIWSNQGRQLIKQLQGDAKARELKKRITVARRNAKNAENMYDEYAQHLFREKIGEQELVSELRQFEAFVAQNRVALESAEIDLRQYAHRTALKMGLHQSLIEEIARQIYLHQKIYQYNRQRIIGRIK